MNDLKQLEKDLVRFTEERHWSQYHNPKNFAIALMCEAGELLDAFTWVEGEQSKKFKDDAEKRAYLEKEMGDVLINLVQLGHHLEIDVLAAAFKKLEKLQVRYAEAVVNKGTYSKIPDSEDDASEIKAQA